ncbi:hypothetical protein COCC4DRAFT_33127, partial [Bipolaris maydis ATCC 48331]
MPSNKNTCLPHFDMHTFSSSSSPAHSQKHSRSHTCTCSIELNRRSCAKQEGPYTPRTLMLETRSSLGICQDAKEMKPIAIMHAAHLSLFHSNLMSAFPMCT